MKIFVVNCGSSSIKYQLFSMTNETVLAKGIVERVGSNDAVLHHTYGNARADRQVDAPDHSAAMKIIIEALADAKIGVIKSIDEIQAVGHRVVHGGEEVTESRIIDDELIGIISRNCELAPLHNPPNLSGIRGAMQAMPHVPHVAVFDTAFLATLPPHAHRYAVPDEWYTKYHVRKYGFHGTSHRYVTHRAAELLGKPVDRVNLITTHLGNGCSITAVAGGKAVDHSMGMTPLEGLIMGTRSGDIDPAVIFYMLSKGFTAEKLDNILNKKSGLIGVSGFSNDMRDLIAAAEKGDARAELATKMFVYRVVKYISAYYGILPDVDAVVLTGGIGENSLQIRKVICESLKRLGAEPDEKRNIDTIRGKYGPITTDSSALAIWVVPTNEELMIARDTAACVTKK